MNGDRDPAASVNMFPESDYRFGAGTLWMRVEGIDWTSPFRQDGEDWYEVEGVEVTSDGREVGRRHALVRGSRLSALRGSPVHKAIHCATAKETRLS